MRSAFRAKAEKVATHFDGFYDQATGRQGGGARLARGFVVRVDAAASQLAPVAFDRPDPSSESSSARDTASGSSHVCFPAVRGDVGQTSKLLSIVRRFSCTPKALDIPHDPQLFSDTCYEIMRPLVGPCMQRGGSLPGH